jgi:hypothetical protein
MGAPSFPFLMTHRRRLWPLLAVALSMIPIAGVFTLSRIFMVRDLTLTFHSRFLFLRHSLWSEHTIPLWDPYVANGQPVVNDALYQLFHLPSLLLRLLLPENIAFNTWVALPVPLCAAGAYLYLRRYVSPPAAAFGAVAFAGAGPIVSTTNFPNLSWSIAAVPFVFWAADRVIERRTPKSATLLALIVSCQALAGEPVSLAATLIILAAYATVLERRWRDWRLVMLVGTGAVAGVLLSAIQYVPLLAASRASLRGAMIPTDFWAFHPLALIELLVPHFFGDYFQSNLHELAWMLALNSDRDPFYYTMYMGVPVLMLAATAGLSGRPRTRFWLVVFIVCAVASLGPHTPLYPALQALVPPLKTFRFPVKYFSLGAFAIAILAAHALEWCLAERPDLPPRASRSVLIGACVLAGFAYVVIAWVLIAPMLPVRGAFRLAHWAHVPAPVQGAEFLLYRARPLLSSLLLKLLCSAFLLWVVTTGRPERRKALAVLCAFAAIDLLASNSSVNPTMEARLLGNPNWWALLPPDMHQRVFIGGRLEGYVNVLDPDAPKYAAQMDGYTQMEQRHLLVIQMIFNPSGARMRESLSYDLPLLWPKEYAQLVGRFMAAPRADRLRYLKRAGTRYVILPQPPFPGATKLATLSFVEQLMLFEFDPQATRVSVVPDALMGKDFNWELEAHFNPRFDSTKGVLVSEYPPPASGVPGLPVSASATFIEDGLNRVVVRATTPRDGYLSLYDTYNPDWRVEVDGQPATLMRANALFRAVHLVPGDHVVTFTYHPAKFYMGLAITAVTALGLVLWCVWRRPGG